MENKIFFFDIDGTLYNQKNVPQSALDSICELQSKGYFVFIATGRPEVLVYKFIEQVKPNGFIALNGGAAYLGNEKLFEYFITKDTLSELVTDIVNNNDSYTMMTNKEYVTNDLNHKVLLPYIKAFNITELQEKSSDYYKDNDIKALVIHANDFNYYFNKYPNLNFYKINDYGYEVVENNYSKGTGCIDVAKKLNVSMENTYCFGDELNDLAMFEVCNHSVAMGNACDELKQIARYTTKHIDEDGIEYALKNILKVI